MIISEVLRQSALDLDIAVLHPGGGQYDTLSLVTYEGNSILHVNRNGVNALANDTLVEDIFDTAAKSPAAAAAAIIRGVRTANGLGWIHHMVSARVRNFRNLRFLRPGRNRRAYLPKPLGNLVFIS